MDQQFAEDVEAGLLAEPKYLSSRYFYDEIGDQLFIEIMHMPEYYLTDAEFEIFSERSRDIIELMEWSKDEHFELIELGPGDCLKTKELLAVLVEEGYDFRYVPIDISQHALDSLESDLHARWPQLKIDARRGDYFRVLSALETNGYHKAILFLGSNMGNLLDDRAHDFVYGLGEHMRHGDKILVGLDLLKPYDVVMPAYNDNKGITARFNLNLLERINRELGGNFNIEAFRHAPEYDQSDGVARSFIESKIDQKVYVEALDKSFSFKKGEKIHTEISRKYNDAILKDILEETDLEICGKLTDSRKLFADYVICRQ